jgi:hypothetical protein
MDFTDWLSLLATVSAVLLFLLVILRISRTTKKQRSDRKLQSLNDIEDWAKEVISCGFGEEFNQARDIKDEKQLRSFTLDHLGKMRRRFVAMRTRGRRMGKITTVFEDDLQEAVSLLTERLVDHVSLLSECINAVPKNTAAPAGEFDEVLARAIASEEEISKSAYIIIEAITRNRTIDVADETV